MPVRSRGSPSASFGPAVCTKSKSIGQETRITSFVPAFTRSVFVGPKVFAPSASAQTWHPWTTCTIERRTVGETAAAPDGASTTTPATRSARTRRLLMAGSLLPL